MKRKKILKFFGILILSFSLFLLEEYYAVCYIMDYHASPEKNITLISHRGAAGLAPENTLAAIEMGLQYQAPFIEVDIHRTKDNVLVVMHDKSVNRTTNGKGLIRDLNWSDIAALDAGSHFSRQFKSAGVPTLNDVLIKIKPSGATLIVEVKDPGLYPGIGAALLNLLRQTETTDRVIVISFDINFLLQFNRLAPDIKIGCLYLFPPKPSAPELRVAKIVSVHWLSNTFYQSRLQALRSNGIETWAWTVNTKRQIEKLRRSGFTGVVTDFPNI